MDVNANPCLAVLWMGIKGNLINLFRSFPKDYFYLIVCLVKLILNAKLAVLRSFLEEQQSWKAAF